MNTPLNTLSFKVFFFQKIRTYLRTCIHLCKNLFRLTWENAGLFVEGFYPGGDSHMKQKGCSSEIWNLTPKGDHLGVAQAFCDP